MADAQTGRAMNPAEWSMLLALSLLWGGSFLFTGMAVRSLPPVTFVLLRVGPAAIALWAFAWLSGRRFPTDVATWRCFAVMGLLNNVIPFMLIVWAQGHIASGLAAILNATTPLWGVVVAHVWTTDEKITAGRLIGLAAGLAGVTAMIGPDTLTGLGTNVFAQFAVLGAALSYAVAGVYGRRFRAMGIDPVVTAAGQVTSSAVMVAPLALLLERPWTLPMPGLDVWVAVIGIAMLSTALAYILYFRILATAGAVNLLLVTFLIPVSAILLGAVVLKEHLAAQHFIGMALIGLGLAAIDGRLVPSFAAWRLG